MLPSQLTLFDIPREVCYLNAASYSPLPLRTQEAARAAVGRKGRPWTLAAGFANEQHERARNAAARLINADGADIALIPSISYGVATAAKLLTIARGTRVVVLENDHSSPVLEWRTRAEAQGFSVETVQSPGDGDWTSAVLGAIEKPGAAPPAPKELDKAVIRWQGPAGDGRAALIMDQGDGRQKMSLWSWNADRAGSPKELLKGRRLAALPTIDERYLCIRDAAPESDQGPDDRKANQWSIFAADGGERLAQAPYDPGTECVAVVGPRVFFLVSGPLRGPIDRPFVRRNGRLTPATWAEAFEVVVEKLKGAAPDRIGVIAGDLQDAESMKAALDLFGGLGVTSFDCRQDGTVLGAGARESWLFNSTLACIEHADAVLLIGTNPRLEAPVLNAHFRKMWLAGKTRFGLIGQAADAFAGRYGAEIVPSEYFRTEMRWRMLQEKLGGQPDASETGAATHCGTVGCVALDERGNLAAGTSTGGITGKLSGRVGDSPVIGAGTFADNASCAVSGTGEGEYFLRAVAAHDIAALVEYKGLSVAEAARIVIHDKMKPAGGNGGVIVLDARGHLAITYSSEGMYRGYVTRDGAMRVMIFDR